MKGQSRIKVLVVEDEPAQLELLTYNLEKNEGYQTIAVTDGEEVVLVAEEQNPALIILDWMLPGLSGIEVCRQLKRNRHTKDIPVLMLTARGEESDKVRGLDTGADDYMVKPYSVVELMARARALIRRTNPERFGALLHCDDITLDPEQFTVERNGKSIHLGPTEFKLLLLLIKRPGRVWTRDQLLEQVWEDNLDIELRTVDVHIGRLRKALRQSGQDDPIRTIRSVGYSLGKKEIANR